MYNKKAKLNREQRSEEVISRFHFIDNEEYQIKCAIEIAKEAIYQNQHWGSAEQSNKYTYWSDIEEILEKKLQNEN